MSDSTICYFDRHNIKIVNNNSDYMGRKVLVFQVCDGDWEVLSNKELVCKLVKSRLLGVDNVFIDGDTHKFLKFMVNLIPYFENNSKISLCINMCKLSFINKLLEDVTGFCIDLDMPLKNKYMRNDRILFKQYGEYRTPEKYKDLFNEVFDTVSKKERIIRINDYIIKNQDLNETIEYLKNMGCPFSLRSNYS